MSVEFALLLPKNGSKTFRFTNSEQFWLWKPNNDKNQQHDGAPYSY